ncbi:ATP-grasp domain-containing protein [Amycolatopsis aidingensis]|uniref:ATP-grasp domain-containing protein n=1 Tax=Amycolatopsis aidingensis TaxID=2842453 RepID=UPI001C0AFDF2|nr:ATP-grasp domain-containing protein [Amycolatopsis aidingensis]
MRIGVLGWDREESESLSLLEHGLYRGHDMTLFTLDDVGCRPGGTGVEPCVGQMPVSTFDLIMCRPELRPDRIQIDYERFALLSDVPGVVTMDAATPYFLVENKLLALRQLADVGLPIAPSLTCTTVAEVADALERWGRVVLKPSFGYGGNDVERVGEVEADRPVIDYLLGRYRLLLCQPFLPHPEGDFRITVVGDRAPLNFRRVPASDHWKANTMLGATVHEAEPPAELIDMAIEAARAVGITVAGLDFVPDGNGYRILEINNTPGWYLSRKELRTHLLDAIFLAAESHPDLR